MRDYKYVTKYLNYIQYLIPKEIFTKELHEAIEKYNNRVFMENTSLYGEFTWTFAEREAFLEMLNNENTIILR